MKKILWPIIVVPGAFGLVLGILGYTQVYCPDFPSQCSFVGILNIVARTIGLFFPGGDIPADQTGNTSLAWARVLAPAATMFSVIEFARLVFEFLTGRITLYRAGGLPDHTIIAGCGERGQYFLHDCQDHLRKDLVVIDRVSDPAITQNAHDAGALFIQGDARNATLLADTGLARAQQLMILGGNDEQNLEVLAAAQSIQRKSGKTLEVIVRIDNVLLVRQLDREDDFARRPDLGIDVTAFNLAAATARSFFRTHPLVDQAELRGQKRVHLVCVGWTPFVFAVLEQLARLSPYREFPRPLVHLLVPDSNAVRTELGSVQPAIWDVLDIEIANLDNTSSIPSPEQISVVEPDAEAAVTAVLVSVGNDAETAAAAMAIRERSQQYSRWHAPVYAHVAARSALSGLLEQKSHAPDPGLAVIPIGYHEDACRMDALFGEREEIARKIHESYLTYKDIDRSSEPNQRDDNNQEWEHLKQTYRLACRRAADHLPIKILSIGARQNGSPFIAAEGLGFAASQEELESLSELEHRSWEIDRRLDGWHPGTSRDNHARTHPALISYKDLSEEVKDFDRDLIRAIAQYLLREGDLPTVKREVRLGIFGHNKVTHDEKAHMLRELDQTVMPGLMHTHKHDFISVCTPLAPGTDTILAEAVLGKLKDAGIDHRLVVVRSLPLNNVIDDFLKNYSDGNAWRLVEEAPQSDDAPDVKSEMSAHISALSESVANAYVADLTPPGLSFDDFATDDRLRVSAYDRAASWLVEKSEIIIAYHDPQRGAGGKGGTRETLEKARKEAELRDHSKLRVTAIGP